MVGGKAPGFGVKDLVLQSLTSYMNLTKLLNLNLFFRKMTVVATSLGSS